MPQLAPSSINLDSAPGAMNADNSLNESNRAESSDKAHVFSTMDCVAKKEDCKSDRSINFAQKMHYVLSYKECRDTIAWLPSGRSFCILDKEKFVDVILPKFFKSRANFNSFERRLKTWGFEKIDTNTHLYILTHDKFGKDKQVKAELKKGESYNLFKQLRIVLNSTECQPFISWLPSGNSFCINHKDKFVNNVLFKYFGETEFKVFMKTLKSKGFKRVKVNDFVGDAVYSHELFQIDRPDLCVYMTRGEIPPMKKNKKKEGEKLSSVPLAGDGTTIEGKVPQEQEEGKPASAPFVAGGITTGGDATAAATEARAISAVKSPPMVNQADPGSHEGMISRMNPTNTMMMQNQFFMNSPAMKNYFAETAMHNATGMNTSQQHMMQLPVDHPMFAPSSFSQRGMQLQTTYPSAARRQSDSMALQQQMAQNYVTGQPIYESMLANTSAARRQSDSMALQQQMAQNYITGMSECESVLPNTSAARRQSDSIALYNQQVAENRVRGESNQGSMFFQHATDGNNFQQWAKTAATAPQKGESPESDRDLRLAMLKVDSELLKVKEMKLLKMQQQLKMQLEMNGEN